MNARPSWQAKLIGTFVRLLLRREHWGNERRLSRRARMLFGAPRPYGWLRSRGVRIEPSQHPQIRGEWIRPVGAHSSGVILYIHGGGFVCCSPVTHRPITAQCTRGTNRPVFALDYRLAPEHRFPAALDDTVAAYKWLLQQVPANQIAVAGDSAGGGLTLSLLVRAREEGLALPACAVLLSPWVDLTGTADSLHSNDGRCHMFRPSNVRDFAQAYLGTTSPKEKYASPLFADLSGLPPVLLQVGSTELLLDDAKRVHEKIRQSGGESVLEVSNDVFHVWQMLDGIIPEARMSLDSAARFITEHVA